MYCVNIMHVLCKHHACIDIVAHMTSPRQSSMSLKGVCCHLGSVTNLLDVTPSNPLAHHLNSFHFMLLKFKGLVAKQHPTNNGEYIVDREIFAVKIFRQLLRRRKLNTRK